MNFQSQKSNKIEKLIKVYINAPKFLNQIANTPIIKPSRNQFSHKQTINLRQKCNLQWIVCQKAAPSLIPYKDTAKKLS